MQRKFRVIPCTESEYSNGFVVVEVLLLEHDYAIPENEILILNNDAIGIGDVVATDGTILKDVPDPVLVQDPTEEELKQMRIDTLNYIIQEQSDLVTWHQDVITKCSEKISAINANTPNITFGSAEIRNASNNTERLVLLNAAITNSQNEISIAAVKIDQANSELTTLQS